MKRRSEEGIERSAFETHRHLCVCELGNAAANDAKLTWLATGLRAENKLKKCILCRMPNRTDLCGDLLACGCILFWQAAPSCHGVNKVLRL